jgi:hypothetical protein
LDDSDNSFDNSYDGSEATSSSSSSSNKSHIDDESALNSDNGSAMDVNASEPDDKNELFILTARNTSEWCCKWLSTADSQKLIMTQ